MSFNRAYNIIEELEGKDQITSDPNDPGGLTKYGISQKQYPNVNIRELTRDKARNIYRRDYWNKIKGDKLPWPLNILVFDCAVNQGVSTSILLLQKTIRAHEDGIIGPKTISRIQLYKLDYLTELFLANRALRYTRTKNFHIYGKGWLRRLFKVLVQTQE